MYRLYKPGLTEGLIHLMTEFGIQHGFESCVLNSRKYFTVLRALQGIRLSIGALMKPKGRQTKHLSICR